jgi:hypothetical protein
MPAPPVDESTMREDGVKVQRGVFDRMTAWMGWGIQRAVRAVIGWLLKLSHFGAWKGLWGKCRDNAGRRWAQESKGKKILGGFLAALQSGTVNRGRKGAA